MCHLRWVAIITIPIPPLTRSVAYEGGGKVTQLAKMSLAKIFDFAGQNLDEKNKNMFIIVIKSHNIFKGFDNKFQTKIEQ